MIPEFNFCLRSVHQVQGDREPDGHPDLQRRLLDLLEGCFHLAVVHPAGRPRGRFLSGCLHAGEEPPSLMTTFIPRWLP